MKNVAKVFISIRGEEEKKWELLKKFLQECRRKLRH